MVVIPSIKEQQLTAHRVEILGCGTVLERSAVTSEILRQNAYALLEDNAMKSRLDLMQKKMNATSGYRRAAEAIVQYTHAHRFGGNPDSLDH
jgi:UDP:flavonoid glycosyltransferase YjiC (YdhE family)